MFRAYLVSGVWRRLGAPATRRGLHRTVGKSVLGSSPSGVETRRDSVHVVAVRQALLAMRERGMAGGWFDWQQNVTIPREGRRRTARANIAKNYASVRFCRPSRRDFAFLHVLNAHHCLGSQTDAGTLQW